MEIEVKLILRGLATSIAGFFLLMWGMSDLIILLHWPPVLIFIVPGIVAIVIMIVCISVSYTVRKKEAHFNPQNTFPCDKCGTQITLESKFCENCGKANEKRLEVLDELSLMEKKVQERKAELLQKSQSKKWKTPRTRKLEETDLELLNKQARNIKMRILKLTIGSTLDDKIKWAKEEYAKGTSLHDIADSLGENLVTARRYIDSE